MRAGPLVSVVMPSLNQVAFIGSAIDSIQSQDYPHIELIVADGGSTDGTVELLSARQSDNPRLSWVTGKDSGPAQAVNTALSLIRGTVVGWLNSDDLYAPGAIQRAVTALQANQRWLMVYGQALHVDGSGGALHRYPTLEPSTPLVGFAQGCFICQPTVFTRRTMWKLLGPLDESLRTAFDFDYWLRAFAVFPARIGFVDAVQAYSRLHASCITVRMRRAVALEGMRVLAKHLGSAPKEWLLTYANELLNSPYHGEFNDIQADIDDALAIASEWLSKADMLALRMDLNKILPQDRGDS